MGKSTENLMEAFAGESQANRKYLAFALQAEKEGYPQVAKLFRAVAEAETVHALSHFRVAGGIGSTRENLEKAISGETYEFTSMYPKMIEEAKSEGNSKAERTLTYANEVEKVHASLFKKVLEGLDKLEETDYFVCQVCGYTCEGEAPERCPICGGLKKVFKKVD